MSTTQINRCTQCGLSEIPPDVQARLIEAAYSVMADDEFIPLSQRDLELWLARNAEAVGQRAKDLQEAMFVKILSHEREVTAMLSEAVYKQIRKEQKQ